MYYGVDYVNKESKNIDYITYNIGATIDYFKAGVSFQDEHPLLNLGFSTKATILDLDEKPDIEYSVSISVKSDISENNIFNIKSEVKKWLTEKVNIFGLLSRSFISAFVDIPKFNNGIISPSISLNEAPALK